MPVFAALCRLVAWLSIGACFFFVIAWIASLFVGVRLTNQGMRYELADASVCWMNDPPVLLRVQPPPPTPPGPAKWEFFDPSASAVRPRPALRGELGLYWSALIFGLAGAALWLFEAFALDGLEIRRRRRGRCAGCNYDRGGLQAGAACPECGAGAI